MTNYKITKPISDEMVGINEGLQKSPWFEIGDEIYYNEWLNRWGKEYDCYAYRMLTKEFIESHKDYFEEAK